MCNNCEQMNVLDDILNAGDNVEDQEDYGFTGSFLKIAPTVIDDSTKQIDEYATRKCDITGKYREYWQTIRWNKLDKYDRRERIWRKNQIDEKYEDISPDDIEVLKVGTLGSKG